jgi:GMP synthase-like glutamine amidotransferase
VAIPLSSEATFTYLSPVRGEKLPAPDDFDGFILTGSKHSTYERSPWMVGLIALLQQLRQKRIPVFGICFGHQIMADAYGGLNAKSSKDGASALSNTTVRRPTFQDALPHLFPSRSGSRFRQKRPA